MTKKMYIIAGDLKGRTFRSPDSSKTHPMSAKIRAALFNIFGDIEGLTLLDCFAGSGSVSFEAASRKADRIVAIESDDQAQKVITSSLLSLGLTPKVTLVKSKVSSWLASYDELFDIVVADPPYDDIQPNQLNLLADRVKLSGLFVLSLPAGLDFKLESKTKNFNLLRQKTYGQAKLVIYRRLS